MFSMVAEEGFLFQGSMETLLKTAPTQPIVSIQKPVSEQQIMPQPSAEGDSRTQNYLRDIAWQQKPVEVFHAYQVMHHPVKTLSETATLGDARETMRHYKIGHLPVVSASKKLIGMITEHDVLKLREQATQNKSGFEALDAKPIGECMSKPVYCADSHADIRRIAKVMLEFHIGSMPILEAQSMVGLITRTDILMGLIHFPPLRLWA